jgi:hypothetical protein
MRGKVRSIAGAVSSRRSNGLARWMRVREEIRQESEFDRSIESSWEAPRLTDEEALKLLRRVGGELQKIEARNEVLRGKGPRERALTSDLVRLTQYFNGSSGVLAYGRWIASAIGYLAYVIPGINAGSIYGASLYEPTKVTQFKPNLRGISAETMTLRRFGGQLVMHAEILTTWNLSADQEAASIKAAISLDPNVAEVREQSDFCGEYASNLGEAIARLQVAVIAKATPKRLYAAYGTYAVLGIAGFVAVITGPWSNLGDKTALNGVASLLGPLVGFMIGSAALCAAVRNLLSNQLCHRSIAAAKTLGKATAAVFGLFTITFAVGLADQDNKPWATLVGLVLLVATALTTLSADYLVNAGEARLKELS